MATRERPGVLWPSIRQLNIVVFIIFYLQNCASIFVLSNVDKIGLKITYAYENWLNTNV